MSKQIEDFINENRAEFDSHEINKNVWNNLEQTLTKSKKKNIFTLPHFWMAAATVTILLFAAIFYMIKSDEKKQIAKKANATIPKEELAAADSAIAFDMYRFAQLKQIKQRELQKIEKYNPELYKQFINDINELDSSYKNLRSSLPSNPNRELLLEEMINNLQLQVELLNKQLHIIKTIKASNNENKTI